jgi:hypothetical protein
MLVWLSSHIDVYIPTALCSRLIYAFILCLPWTMPLKSTIPYVRCLDGFYWWMMPIFLPPPTVSPKNFFFPFVCAGWSLTLWCFERRCTVWMVLGERAKKRERKRLFSPAASSAAAEKLWSCSVLPCDCHWLLGSRGEWMCSDFRTIQLLGRRRQCFVNRIVYVLIFVFYVIWEK